MISNNNDKTKTIARKSLSDFLEQIQLNNIDDHIVIGNEAGDADSIISSLTLAYVDSSVQPTSYSNVVNNDSNKKTPIVPIKRADLCLRRETVLLLYMIGIDTNKLIYIDDLVEDSSNNNDEKICSSNNNKRLLTLVDHNSLKHKEFQEEAWDVKEILDHHFDEGNHIGVTDDCRNVAFNNKDGNALVGSTCTLIAERMIKLMEPPYSADLSLALLGPIVLDTVNMSPEAGKGTDRDAAAIQTLIDKTDWSKLPERASFLRTESSPDSPPDLTKFHKYLQDSKFDVEFWKGLSGMDALRLDYKRFEVDDNKAKTTGDESVFGASSILLPISSFLSKDGLISDIKKYMDASNIPLLAVLSFSIVNGSTPQRELLIAGKDKDLVDDMSNYLSTNDMLDLTEISSVSSRSGNEYVLLRYFKQGNAKASRKQVAPIMLQFYEQ